MQINTHPKLTTPMAAWVEDEPLHKTKNPQLWRHTMNKLEAEKTGGESPGDVLWENSNTAVSTNHN